MTQAARHEPGYLHGESGRLFSVYYPAIGGGADGPALLHLPAFAEEMNKSRHVVADTARRLAGGGTAVLTLDPHGTGDSDGDFEDATWELWLRDVDVAMRALRERGHQRIGLWGLRLGCLLAADAMARQEGVSSLVLWAPVASGDQFLSRFLRLRVAGASIRGGEKESVKDLRQRLVDGEAIEVGGYSLCGQLAIQMAAACMVSSPPPAGTPVHWYDLLPDAAAGTPPASQRVLESWREAGAQVQSATVLSEPFWTTQELAQAPELAHRTSTDLAA